MLLHLRILLGLRPSPLVLSTCLLSRQSILLHPHLKILFQKHLGGGGRRCPGVLPVFGLASYNNSFRSNFARIVFFNLLQPVWPSTSLLTPFILCGLHIKQPARLFFGRLRL